ncbi:MAG: biopolymer transporter ExbD [Bdellovibrio sp.]
MRRRYQPPTAQNSEFELDLAPLLAVMVKLVPVLLISSAFVQVMMIESDLPQVVKEAVHREEDPRQNPPTTISLSAHPEEGFRLQVSKPQGSEEKLLPLKEGRMDLAGLHQVLVDTKAENPESFRIELAPHPNLPYDLVVRIMDEARRARDRKVRFEFTDPRTGQAAQTDFMFPDVVFSNLME